MRLSTLPIPTPPLPSPLPTSHEALLACAYPFWRDLCAQVRAHNASLPKGKLDAPWMLREPTRAEIAAVMPAKVNAAMTLASYNYQVGNGGHFQHADNGYADTVNALLALMAGAAAVGVSDAAEGLAVVTAYSNRLAEREDVERAAREERSRRRRHDEDDMDDEPTGVVFGDLDERWNGLDGEALCQAVLDRFEEVMAASFNGLMRRAA